MSKKTFAFTSIGLVMIAAIVAFSVVSSGGNIHAQQPSNHPRFKVMPMHQLGLQPSKLAAAAAQATTSIPTWSSSFTFQGQTYPYTMIGTDPHQGSQTTTIPVDIVPLLFTFSDGTKLDGSTIVSKIAASPLFNAQQFDSGNTQYTDAIQRGEFWSSVNASAPDYHVLLGTPVVHPAVTLNVPAQSGSVTTINGQTVGQVDINWFSPQADGLATGNGLDATHLTIFAAVNINEYDGTPAQCCIGGYHTAVQNGNSLFTYAYADYDMTGSVFNDVDALSHELAEWANDPFTNNTVPNWSVADQPQYGCNNALEVGDPLVGHSLTVNGYHVQDEAFFSWFAHETPSQGINGRYDYLGLFNSPATVCQAN